MSSTPTPLTYFEGSTKVKVPTLTKRLVSRIAFPLLCLLSRERSLRLGLTPIDDERVIMALKHVRGRVLDIGCGANNFVRSYGNGVGVDVVPWDGCDQVIEDAAHLPFESETFDTVSFLACLNHIPNRDESIVEAHRVLKPGGRLIVTMITPRLGRFIHWLRARNDPDHKERHIDHAHELLGMDAQQVERILLHGGFRAVRRKRFVFAMNSLYLADKPDTR